MVFFTFCPPEQYKNNGEWGSGSIWLWTAEKTHNRSVNIILTFFVKILFPKEIISQVIQLVGLGVFGDSVFCLVCCDPYPDSMLAVEV